MRKDLHVRLLVVDDEPAIRQALDLVLSLNGFDVALAVDGREQDLAS